jgi:hypothetical protein
MPSAEWDGEEDLEFITEVEEASMIDEDLEGLLQEVKSYHGGQITHYKRLLEQSQSSSSLQLHALQAEVKLLRSQLESEKENTRQLHLANASAHPRRMIGDGSSIPESWTLSDLLTVNFDEIEVKKAIKALKRKERLRL